MTSPPGIPRLFQAMVGASKERFSGPAHLAQDVYTKVGIRDGGGGRMWWWWDVAVRTQRRTCTPRFGGWVSVCLDELVVL